MTSQKPTLNAPSADSTFAASTASSVQKDKPDSSHDSLDKSPALDSTIVPATSDALPTLEAGSTDKPSADSSQYDKNPPASLLSPTHNAPSVSSTDKQVEHDPKTYDSVLPKIPHSEPSSTPILSQSPSILTVAPPADTPAETGLG